MTRVMKKRLYFSAHWYERLEERVSDNEKKVRKGLLKSLATGKYHYDKRTNSLRILYSKRIFIAEQIWLFEYVVITCYEQSPMDEKIIANKFNSSWSKWSHTKSEQ